MDTSNSARTDISVAGAMKPVPVHNLLPVDETGCRYTTTRRMPSPPWPQINFDDPGPLSPSPSYATRNGKFSFIRPADEMRACAWDQGRMHEPMAMGISSFYKDAENAFSFAVEYIECLMTLTDVHVDHLSQIAQEIRTWLPHSFSPIGNCQYILLNWYGVPVGYSRESCKSFLDFEHLIFYLSREFATLGPDDSAVMYQKDTPPWSSTEQASRYLAMLKDFRDYASLEDVRSRRYGVEA